MSEKNIICQICLGNVDDPINFCVDMTHENSCKECLLNYIHNSITTSHFGSCPIISCPSMSHKSNKKRRILRFDEWKKYSTPEMTRRYVELANSLLIFLCGGCHTQKSLDVGYEADQSGDSHNYLAKYLTTADDKSTVFQELQNDLTSYATGLLSVEELFNILTKTYFIDLMSLSDQAAWEVFIHVLKLVHDPERRANLHLRYLRDHPRIVTLCCSKVHCFRCKVKDYHDGKSCMENTTSLDHSIVLCPNCNIALAKGDGCNTVTCVCGNQFSWSAEKENSDRCQHFLVAFPEHTSVECARILCSEQVPTSSMNQAKAWQSRNRVEVSRALLAWFKIKYWPCPSQCCAILPLPSMPEGVREAASLWKSMHPREVDRCVVQTRVASQALFTTLYPVEADRPAAAYHILCEARRLKTDQQRSTIHGIGLGYWTTQQLLHRSVSQWIENNAAEYSKGIQLLETRSAKQFLHIYGSRPIYSVKPAYVNCPSSSEWSRDASNPDLTFTNENTTVERVGSISCYPAAFASLVSDHCMFQVRIVSAPRTSNWLTFGIARKGMPTSSSDGVGRTTDSWGIADDRSSNSTTIVSSSGCQVASSRKLSEGDVLCAVIDTSVGWCQVSINDDEFVHRFDIPSGSMDDYCFAMTFANDHRVSIIYDESNLNKMQQGRTSSLPSYGELNLEQTQMFNNFKKHLKILLSEQESRSSTTALAAAAEYATSPLKTSSELWIDICGDAQQASIAFEKIHSQLLSLVSTSREFPWTDQDSCALPWLTWNHVLFAVSWYHDNRVALRDERDGDLALSFLLAHGDDAPFIAAINLASSVHTHKIDAIEQESSLAFMRFYAEDMQQWYDYDQQAKEPVLEGIAKGCRCLPRHIKSCPFR